MLSFGQVDSRRQTVANLLVRNVEAEVVDALKARSGKRGVSAEEEHREILRTALLKPRKKDFAEVLLTIPSVGDDRDFLRVQDHDQKHVFD
jgi:plasmid stability protein